MRILKGVFDRLIRVCLNPKSYLIHFALGNIFYVRRPIEVIHSCSGQLGATGADSGSRPGLKNDNLDLSLGVRPAVSDTDRTEHRPSREKTIALEHNRVIMYFPWGFAPEALNHNDDIQFAGLCGVLDKAGQVR